MATSLVKKDALSVETNISDAVLNQVNTLTSEQRLVTPKNYVPANALQSAFLLIAQKYPTALTYQEGTKEYLALQQTLLEMVTMGLNPMKNQCYFIPRGNNLTLFKSYFGDVAAAKNSGLIKDVRAVVIYKGDTIKVEVQDGRRIISSHETEFGNEDNEIIGAYCVVEKTNGDLEYTIMTKKELDRAWAQSSTHDSKFQKGFPQEAAKRTVIRRAIKLLMNSSTDENLIVEAYNHITSQEYDENDEVDNVITLPKTDAVVKEEPKVEKKTTKKKETIKAEVIEEQKEVVETPKEDKVEEVETVEVVETPKTEESNLPNGLEIEDVVNKLKDREKAINKFSAKNRATKPTVETPTADEVPFKEEPKIEKKPDIVVEEPKDTKAITPEVVVKRVEVKSSSKSNDMMSILEKIKNKKNQ